MKFNKLLLLLFLPLFFAACDKDDDNGGDDPNLEPIVLSGTENAPLTLENLFNNPDRVDYIIRGTWNIESPVIVEPGVRFMMESSSRIRVRASGSFNAVGTEENPIYFEGEQSAQGFWEYIAFESNNPNNRLEHTIIRHGGGSNLNSYPAAVVVRNNAQVGIVNTQISNSQRNGFLIGDDNSVLSEFRDNIFSDCALYPISLRATQARFMDASTEFTSGNGFNQIRVSGNTINSPMVIQPVAGPYVFTENTRIDAPVEILPGTYIEMGPGARIDMRSTGSLSAVGTPTERITFTGEQTAKGYWDYIYFNGSNSPNNQFKYVDVSYAGGSNLNCCGGAISLASGAFFSMENSSVTNSQRWGIRIRGNSTFEDLSGNVFSGNEVGDIDD
ncbi:MAG: hypothetical protein EA362_12190 [Saprospirales bacterium]|nr:MAG: hypothetical protein EA362_12190 [Saprospirales bacterium]